MKVWVPADADDVTVLIMLPLAVFHHFPVILGWGTLKVTVPDVTVFGTPVVAFPVALFSMIRTWFDDPSAAYAQAPEPHPPPSVSVMGAAEGSRPVRKLCRFTLPEP